MALLKVEAEKLSANKLVSGVITEIIDRDDLFAILPFTGINGKAYVYNRENELATADWLDPNDEVKEGASTFTEVTTNLRILAGDVDVDKFILTTMSDHNNQLAVQIAAKAKGLGRMFRKALVQGDHSQRPKEFDGIEKLVVSTQTNDAGKKPLTFSMLDELLSAVPLGADCIMMRSGTLRAYMSLLRATSGTNAPLVMLPNFSMPICAHNGVPIIVNDFIPMNSTSDGCNVYAMRLNETDGLHGLYGGENAGIVVESLGTVQNKDAVRTRLKWYCGLALKSTKSLAALKDVKNV